MKKSNKKNMPSKGMAYESYEYEELLEMMESGMDDREIAAEMGISESYLAKVKNEVYKDMI